MSANFAKSFAQNFSSFGESLKNPFDLNQVFSTVRRNIEALAAANQMMVESVQEISRRQTEVMRSNVETVLQASRDMVTSGTPETNLTKQATLTKSLFETALGNLREVTEMATKSGFEAFDVLNKRAAESLEEISKSAPASAGSKKKNA